MIPERAKPRTSGQRISHHILQAMKRACPRLSIICIRFFLSWFLLSADQHFLHNFAKILVHPHPRTGGCVCASTRLRLNTSTQVVVSLESPPAFPCRLRSHNVKGSLRSRVSAGSRSGTPRSALVLLTRQPPIHRRVTCEHTRTAGDDTRACGQPDPIPAARAPRPPFSRDSGSFCARWWS